MFPDGFVVAFGPVRFIPVVDPGGLAIELPPTDEPVAPVAVEPPTLEPAPDVPGLLWANANELESASAPAKAIVISFMVFSLVNYGKKTGTGHRCSCTPEHEGVRAPA